MVSREVPDEEEYGPFKFGRLSRAAETRRRGLLRRLALFAAGVKVRLLDYVPSEEVIYSVLGTCVIVTSIVATIASAAAIGYLAEGRAYIGPLPIIAGLGVGLLIFTIDRALVKAPLNPYSFEPEVLHALWNPSSDARWYDVLSGKIVRGRPARRFREMLAVLVKASPRFLIAIATSFVFAEIALFLMFSTEVTLRAEAIQQQQQQQQINELNKTYQDKRQQLQNAITEEAGADDPVLASLNQKLVGLNARLPGLSSDTAKLGQAAADEVDGIKVTFTLSNGAVISTTGKPDSGPSATNLEQEHTTYSAELSQLRTQIATVTNQINKQRSKDAATASKPINALKNQEAVLDKQHATDLQKMESGTGPVKGVLIREQALNQLANDMNPSTIVVDPPPACGSSVGGAWCHLARFFVEPTPLGPFVGALRLFFISIELLPILMKIFMSLRRRRPYDALIAAIEEVATAASIELVDNQLIQVGALLESRASWRKSQRSGTGAEFILATVSREQLDRYDSNNALAVALNKRFSKRTRLWPRSRKTEQSVPPPSFKAGPDDRQAQNNGHQDA